MYSRRDFILASSVGAGALLTGVASAKRGLASGLEDSSTLVVSRRHGTVKEMVEQCVERLGGIRKFVPEGSKVAIKVSGSRNNVLVDTSPEVVREVVRLVWTANPEEIWVYDHVFAGHTPWYSFQRIASAAWSMGAEPVELHEDVNDYVAKAVPGVGLKSTLVAKVLEEADVLINVPLLKRWGTGLKSHMGSILYRGLTAAGGYEGALKIPDLEATPHNCPGGRPRGVADLNACPTIKDKHRLTIVDAIRPVFRGDIPGEDQYNGIIAGTDPVATDYINLQIVRRYNPNFNKDLGGIYATEEVDYAAALGLGTNDPTKIFFDEGDVSTTIPEFMLPFAITGMLGISALALASGRTRRNQDKADP
jgi:uncharacterized protein (DUF362 family)